MGVWQFVTHLTLLLLVLVILPSEAARGSRPRWLNQESSQSAIEDDEPQGNGTTWAVLVAGSNGFENYRHQADVCHAYQILKRGGLKDENIIVFMYDDIANNPENPRPGVIINSPYGSDVYAGVPKDYIGDNVTVENLFAVLLGNKSALTGGSGKVVDSKPEDRIFLYYTDHGGAGVLCMPNTPFLYANDLIEVLEKKHAAGTYKEMVMYVEACESGSMFDGLMPENLNIYVTTASNPSESSWATYCPGMSPPPPPEYDVCLGDLFSVAWLEDSDAHNLKNETIAQQYENVKLRTYNNHSQVGSHVMEYGSKGLKSEDLYLYQGSSAPNSSGTTNIFYNGVMGGYSQRWADIFALQSRVDRLPDNSKEKEELLVQITEEYRHRAGVDINTQKIALRLFGQEKYPSVLNTMRAQGQPVVDDWGCLKSTVRSFETHCGSLSQYGVKFMRQFANICNSGATSAAIEAAAADACKEHDMGKWSPLILGYSA